MSYEPLMDAVVEIVLFLELSDESVVDEDAAVAMMEQIASTLHRLEAPEKERFLQYLARRAQRTESNSEQQAIENMTSNLGLTPE